MESFSMNDLADSLRDSTSSFSMSTLSNSLRDIDQKPPTPPASPKRPRVTTRAVDVAKGKVFRLIDAVNSFEPTIIEESGCTREWITDNLAHDSHRSMREKKDFLDELSESLPNVVVSQLHADCCFPGATLQDMIDAHHKPKETRRITIRCEGRSLWEGRIPKPKERFPTRITKRRKTVTRKSKK
jgi:hypothetical protein